MIMGYGYFGSLLVPVTMTEQQAERYSRIDQYKTIVEITRYTMALEYEDILVLSDNDYKQFLVDLIRYRKAITELEFWLTGTRTYE